MRTAAKKGVSFDFYATRDDFHVIPFTSGLPRAVPISITTQGVSVVIAVEAIKAVRKLKSDLGLSDAKKFVEEAPKTILEAANKEDAEAAKKVLEEAGCVVELK